MKIYHIKDVKSFTEVINSCNGDVNLVCKDGEHDMKKELAKLKTMQERFGNVKIGEIEVIAKEPEDTMKLINYLISA